MNDDIKMIQSPMITSGFIKDATKGHDNVTINVNMNQSVVGQALPIEDESLLAYIETFPQPRLKNFISHLYWIAKEKYGTKSNAARELGCNWRTMHRHEASIEI